MQTPLAKDRESYIREKVLSRQKKPIVIKPGMFGEIREVLRQKAVRKKPVVLIETKQKKETLQKDYKTEEVIAERTAILQAKKPLELQAVVPSKLSSEVNHSSDSEQKYCFVCRTILSEHRMMKCQNNDFIVICSQCYRRADSCLLCSAPLEKLYSYDTSGSIIEKFVFKKIAKPISQEQAPVYIPKENSERSEELKNYRKERENFEKSASYAPLATTVKEYKPSWKAIDVADLYGKEKQMVKKRKKKPPPTKQPIIIDDWDDIFSRPYHEDILLDSTRLSADAPEYKPISQYFATKH